MSRQLQPGDVIKCKGITCTIKEIAWQEPWEWREANPDKDGRVLKNIVLGMMATEWLGKRGKPNE